MTGEIEVVRTFIANTAYEALRDYVFAVIPLFMLMGDFLAKCGAARDLYALGNRASRWLPGRLAAATIVANALFGFVTGVSIAAAAAFSRIAYPEMRRFGYRRDFALGCVAGSACLGMLIPPSVLMIVWCVLTELSIGKLFLAGVIPGLLAAGGMIAYVVIAAKLKPELVGETHASRLRGRRSAPTSPARPPPRRVTKSRSAPCWPARCWSSCSSSAPWGRSGSACARRPRAPASAPSARSSWRVIKGIKPREVWQVVLDVGRTSGPLLLLLFCAQLYSRVLSMTGFTEAAKIFLLGTGLGPWGILIVMVAIWFVLGCLIDSISIILLTVPIFAPIAMHLGFDPAGLRHHGNSGDRNRPADPAVRHPGVHSEIGGARPECGAGRDFPRFHSLLDRAAGRGRGPGSFSATRDFPARTLGNSTRTDRVDTPFPAGHVCITIVA